MTRHTINSKAAKVTAKTPRRGTVSWKAVQLGVTREHLSRVIHGARHSARLTRRLRDLERNLQP